MKRALATALLLATLGVGPTPAAPGFLLRYVNGIPRVAIEGDYRHTHYTVWRSVSAGGPATAITQSDVLCEGPCFADDYSALGGHTYWYRFDLVPAEGSPLSYGPFEATISRDLARPLSATVSPNPGHGTTHVVLFLSGSPGTAVHTDAAVFDLQGRRLATIHRGPLSTGPSRVDWNGRGDDGSELRAGIYLLRAVTIDGRQSVTRLVRTR